MADRVDNPLLVAGNEEQSASSSNMITTRSAEAAPIVEDESPAPTLEMEPKRSDSVLMIPEILTMVLSNMDFKSLVKIRLVSKSWSQVCINLALKNPSWVLSLTEDTTLPAYLILKNTTNPELFLNSIQCKGKMKGEGLRGLRKHLELLLTQFGKYSKILDIRHGSGYEPMPSILNQWDIWCPNLEELKITTLCMISNFKDFGLYRNKLSGLKRLEYYVVGQKRDIRSDLHMLCILVQAASNLKYFKLVSLCDPVVSSTFLKVVTRNPTIFSSLEEVWLDSAWTTEHDPFFHLKDIKFRGTLQTLTLVCRLQFPAKSVNLILRSLQASLKSLSLRGQKDYSMTRPQTGGEIIQGGRKVPLMPKLQRFNNFAEVDCPLKLKEICEKMPNLEILAIARTVDKDISSVGLDTIFSCTTSQLATLKTLVIHGSMSSQSVVTPLSINQAFPNLSRLIIGLENAEFSAGVKINPPAVPAPSAAAVVKLAWIEEVFEGFSEMQNLEQLTLKFMHLEQQFPNLATAFEKLKRMPKLRSLELVGCLGEAEPSFVAAVTSLLLDFPNLKLLLLTKFNTFPQSTEFKEAVLASSTLIRFSSTEAMEPLSGCTEFRNW